MKKRTKKAALLLIAAMLLLLTAGCAKKTEQQEQGNTPTETPAVENGNETNPSISSAPSLQTSQKMDLC